MSLDYETTLELVKSNIEKLRTLKADKELAFNTIILTQLTNESRISEAQEAVVAWSLSPANREIRVRTRKRYDQEERMMIIPSVLTEDDAKVISSFKDALSRIVIRKGKEALDTCSVRKYASRAYGINTHSLRYSGITELGVRKKVSPLVIGKITKHKNLNQLLTYLQEKEAIEELRRQVAQVS